MTGQKKSGWVCYHSAARCIRRRMRGLFVVPVVVSGAVGVAVEQRAVEVAPVHPGHVAIKERYVHAFVMAGDSAAVVVIGGRPERRGALASEAAGAHPLPVGDGIGQGGQVAALVLPATALVQR